MFTDDDIVQAKEEGEEGCEQISHDERRKEV